MLRLKTMFERYTERARRVIFFARYEASQFGSTAIETGHLLLGLMREDKNLTSRFLGTPSGESIRKEIAELLTVAEKVSVSIDLPLSEECKHILHFAAEEAERLNNTHIGTEHLLLGILREEKCLAAQVLSRRGMAVEGIRQELARQPMPPEPASIFPDSRSQFLTLINPALPKSGVVPDVETAKRIAEAVWLPLYGADAVAAQTPLQTELRFNVWIVSGSGAPEISLFAFVLQADGRILSVGQGTAPSKTAPI
jgi:hypothetical protein